MKDRIDMNSDLGESYGAYTMGQDEEILGVITSANIACGYHAGDHNVMSRTVRMAAKENVALGAHPGLPDLIGFGRRAMQVDPEDVYHMIIYQAGALQAFAEVEGLKLQHIKPHGALYNMAVKDAEVAAAIAAGAAALDSKPILFGLAGSELVKEGKKQGLTTANEVFADRTYQPDGTLTPRTSPDAMIHDPNTAAERIIRMLKESKTEAVDGTDIPVQADTICVHGDEKEALDFVNQLRHTLTAEGIRLKKVGE